jgi:P pilus assembly chaperone PapD
MKLFILATLLFLTSWQSEMATASLLVDKAIVIFDEQTDNKLDITVINDDADAKLYVR